MNKHLKQKSIMEKTSNWEEKTYKEKERLNGGKKNQASDFKNTAPVPQGKL